MQREILGTSDFYLNGVASNTGDGIAMCRQEGAVLSNDVSPHLAEFCSNDVLDFYAGYMKFLNRRVPHARPSSNRYMNETFCITHVLARGASGMRRAGSSYIIFTQADFDKLLTSGVHDVLGEDIIAEYKMRRACILVPSYYTLQDEMDAAIAHGQAWKADTLEELGEQAGFDPHDVRAYPVRLPGGHRFGNRHPVRQAIRAAAPARRGPSTPCAWSRPSTARQRHQGERPSASHRQGQRAVPGRPVRGRTGQRRILLVPLHRLRGSHVRLCPDQRHDGGRVHQGIFGKVAHGSPHREQMFHVKHRATANCQKFSG